MELGTEAFLTVGTRVRVKSKSDPHSSVGIVIGELEDDPEWKEVLFMDDPDAHAYAAWELERVGR